MASEIERKYLVDTTRWTPRDAGTPYTQGYLSSAKERTVRIRREGARAVLTIKGPTRGISRLELEYPIPVTDAEQLFALCEQPLIEKVRHAEQHGGRTWEIDVFAGDNAGLVVAEVELADESDVVEVPAWAIREVSDDPRYYNANLIANPYKSWR